MTVGLLVARFSVATACVSAKEAGRAGLSSRGEATTKRIDAYRGGREGPGVDGDEDRQPVRELRRAEAQVRLLVCHNDGRSQRRVRSQSTVNTGRGLGVHLSALAG